MGKRIKTRYVGIYYRYAESRMAPGGRPDKCYDIQYKSGSKYIFEKVGWVSEGFSVEDAIELRGLRIRALRHPELSEQGRKKRKCPTLDEVWAVYKDNWVPRFKNTVNCIALYKIHIQPEFGNRKIDDITALDIDNFKIKLLNTVTKSKSCLKPASVKQILKLFKTIIGKANEWGLTHGSSYNPVGKIDLKDSDAQRERYLTPQEAEKLLDACQHVCCQTYYVVFIGLQTGMRLGEILGLTGEQINLEAGVIALNGKTGRRSAYIPEKLKPMLTKLMPEQSGAHLFLGVNGKPIPPATFSVRFARIVEALGLNNGITDTINKVVFHTLRHTYCSWLAIQGVPLYTIGQLVGHSKPEMTQRYAKLSPDSKRAAIQGIDKMLESNADN